MPSVSSVTHQFSCKSGQEQPRGTVLLQSSFRTLYMEHQKPNTFQQHSLARQHETLWLVQMRIGSSSSCSWAWSLSISSVSVRMKAEQREATWVIFNPALLFFGIITFLLHSRTCLSSWHGNISQLHCFIVSFIYFQIPFHTLLALTRYYTACGEGAADWIVTETTTFLVKNKWIL